MGAAVWNSGEASGDGHAFATMVHQVRHELCHLNGPALCPFTLCFQLRLHEKELP